MGLNQLFFFLLQDAGSLEPGSIVVVIRYLRVCVRARVRLCARVCKLNIKRKWP